MRFACRPETFAESTFIPAWSAGEGAGARRDELWRHTCFELFIAGSSGGGSSSGYREFNFAPDRRWAAYTFSGYRKGMAPLPTPAPWLTVKLDSPGLSAQLAGAALPPRPWRIGLSAVIETATGLSYWALRHPPGPPDFHHPDNFALEWS